MIIIARPLAQSPELMIVFATMTYDELYWITLMMLRRSITERNTSPMIYKITRDQLNELKCDARLLEHVNYDVQALQFKMNNVTVRVK